MSAAVVEGMPRLVGGPPDSAALYAAALENLVLRNTVSGPLAARSDTPARFIRAGGGYAEPWTRDAAINSWNAASVLIPDVAKDTLLMVCEGAAGERVIAQDEQWWDQIIWVVAAWHHFLVTGDRPFLEEARGIAERSLAILHAAHFDDEFGLYAGGAVMQDGISGYPSPPADEDNPSSFVLDHPRARRAMTLSTNALYVGALRALAAMSAASGVDGAGFERRAAELRNAIHARFRIAGTARFGFLVHGAGEERGRLDEHQEGCGLAFLALFAMESGQAARATLAAARKLPFGIPNLWPDIPPYSAERPARHGAILWPMVMGMFGAAAASSGDAALFGDALAELEQLFRGSGLELFEVYNGTTGAVDGGWQTGTHWDSQPDQTWSATAYLRLVHEGVFGLRHHSDGLAFRPVVPRGFAGAVLREVRYRDSSLTVSLEGDGAELVEIVVDGQAHDPQWRLPPDTGGRHEVRLRMRGAEAAG